MEQTTKRRSTLCQPGHPGRAGFSLVELLVASTLMLLVMAAVATLFAMFGSTVTEARALSDLSARLQSVQWRLRQDLAGLTCVPKPLVRVEANAGYFQVIQGPYLPPPPNPNDLLALTTSSPGAPFLGRLSGAMGFESPTAEVVWFTEPSIIHKGQQLYNLHRRQLLVSASPDVGVFNGTVFVAPTPNSDLSFCALVPPMVFADIHANSLGDLSKPANRFLARFGTNRMLTAPRDGEDVILSNVLTFAINTVTQSGDGDTYPMNPAALPFETRDDGNPALPPLKQVEVTIRCLEPLTGQVRVIEVQHSFGEDRIPLP